MKHRIFGRIFFLYALTMLAAVVFVELYITNAVRTSHIDDLKQHLLAQATLISNDISFKSPSSFDSLCRRFKEQTGFRVTVIALNGRVLGDSDTDSQLMENHLGRPEVQQAILGDEGMSTRYSETVHDDLLYVAKRITQDGRPVGIVRLSMELRAVDAAINALRVRIIAVVILVLLATGLISAGQMERIRRLTRQIGSFSRSLAGGAAGSKLHLGSAGEFDEIAESLNTMSRELQNSAAANEEERKRLTAILQSVPDVLLILDAHGVIQLASSASKKYFGDAALPGKQVFEVVRVPSFLTLLEEVRSRLAPGVGELRFDHPEERYFSARISPLSYQDKKALPGFVVILHDITQLKKLEQTRKDFVANISHEIKTPITAIKGFAEALLEGALQETEHAEKFLKIIKANSERINSLVDDLMTISKIELGVVRLEKAPVDLSDAAAQVLALLRPKADEKGLFLRTDFPAEHVRMPADRDKLIQVLTNLVDNSIKFTDKGGVTLGLRREGIRLRLFVEDTGIGIAEKHLPRLGERFYRVDTARSRKMGGTGLGLAIVKHLVKAHGWELQIESVQEKGTIASILFREDG
jgi:two-component system, OmpR family, phosphate regulon sensor histidine kinase PhoR